MRRLPIRELRAGMVIENDVFSADGNLLILKAGTVLTDIWIERLENFAKARGVQELVSARIRRIRWFSRWERCGERRAALLKATS